MYVCVLTHTYTFAYIALTVQHRTICEIFQIVCFVKKNKTKKKKTRTDKDGDDDDGGGLFYNYNI